MSMKDKLKAAGVDTFRAQCYALATRILPKHGYDPAASVADFAASLQRSGVLLEFLNIVAADMKNAAAGDIGVPSATVLPSPAAAPIRGSGSQNIAASHDLSDAGTAPQTQDGAASHQRGDRQMAEDRRPAPVSKAMRTAARAVASSSVFDQRISESIGFVWRDLTGRQLLNVQIKHKWLGAIVRKLAPKWEGRNLDAKLPEVCTEAELKSALEAAEQARQRAALQARRLAHG